LTEKSTIRQYLKKRADIVSVILAFTGAYHFFSLAGKDLLSLANPVALIVLLFVSYFAIRKAIALADRRKLAFSAITGLVYASFLVIGADMSANRLILHSTPNLAAGMFAIIGIVPVISACLILLVSYLPYVSRLLICKQTGINDSKLFFILFAAIVLVWTLCFLAFFPGLFAYDAPAYLHEFNNNELSANFPLLHSILFGVLVKLGEVVFGSLRTGLAIYTVVNMTALAGSAAYSLVFLRRFRLPVWCIAAGAALLAFSPVIALLAISTTIDVLFSALCVLLFLFILDIFLEPERFFGSGLLQIRFVFAILLMALLRNNGIYAFIVSIPFIVFPIKGYITALKPLEGASHQRLLPRFRIWRKTAVIKKTVVLCLAGVLLYVLSAQALKVTFNASGGSPAEALSIPIQQVSRVYVEKGDELDDRDRDSILRLIPSAWNYAPHLSDYVKISFSSEVLTENRAHYLGLWLRLGFQYPGEYASAFLTHTLWLWYLDTDYRGAVSYIETSNKHLDGADLSKAPVIPQLQPYYRFFTGLELNQRYPILAAMLNPVAPTWLMILFLALSIYYKRYRFLFPMFFLIGLWLTVAFSPIILPRYVLMFYVLMPLMACTIFIMPHDFELNETIGVMRVMKDSKKSSTDVENTSIQA